MSFVCWQRHSSCVGLVTSHAFYHMYRNLRPKVRQEILFGWCKVRVACQGEAQNLLHTSSINCGMVVMRALGNGSFRQPAWDSQFGILFETTPKYNILHRNFS